MSERWAILILVAVAVAGWTIFLNVAEAEIWMPFGALFTTIALLAWWIGADARKLGIRGLRPIEGWLLLLLAPVGLGLYLVRARGVAVGLVSLFGFVVLYAVATAVGEWLSLRL